MNITDGVAFKRKQVAKVIDIEGQALKLGAFSMVSSIANAIENKEDIRARKDTIKLFQKLSYAARSVMRQEPASVDLSEQEMAVTDKIGEMVTKGVKSAVYHVAKVMYSAFFKAVRYAIIPIFRIFTSAVSTAFRLVLSNPYVAAGALAALALGAGYKWYKNRDEAHRGTGGVDLPGTPPPAEEKASGKPVQSPVSLPSDKK